MHEIRKLLNQETVIEAAETRGRDYYQLCLVRIGDSQIVPVYMPSSGSGVLQVCDYVMFEYNGERYHTEVLFVADFVCEDDKTWTGVTIATQMVPVRAIKIGHMTTVKWEEENK